MKLTHARGPGRRHAPRAAPRDAIGSPSWPIRPDPSWTSCRQFASDAKSRWVPEEIARSDAFVAEHYPAGYSFHQLAEQTHTLHWECDATGLITAVGYECKTIVGYDPEEVIGKQVTFLANLAPRKMMGLESQGMILMAEDRDGKLSLIAPDDTVWNGGMVS